jgi:5-hydroxyisourate hydrolase
MTISTHVLDASLGTPAAGVSVTLSRLEIGWLDVESGVTDTDGRHRFLAHAPAGTYCLTFGTGAYFAAHSVVTFYPEVAITFTIPELADEEGPDVPGHFHVPLLLSPFAYSTYRGS